MLHHAHLQETSNAQGHYQDTYFAEAQLQETSNAQRQLKETSIVQALMQETSFAQSQLNIIYTMPNSKINLG